MTLSTEKARTSTGMLSLTRETKLPVTRLAISLVAVPIPFAIWIKQFRRLSRLASGCRSNFAENSSTPSTTRISGHRLLAIRPQVREASACFRTSRTTSGGTGSWDCGQHSELRSGGEPSLIRKTCTTRQWFQKSICTTGSEGSQRTA